MSKVTEKPLDRYLGGFDKVQNTLHKSMVNAVANQVKAVPLRAFCERAQIDLDTFWSIMRRTRCISQDILESLAFPLGLMPNALLPFDLPQHDFEIWKKTLVSERLGIGLGSGGVCPAPGKGDGSANEVTIDECKTTILLRALCEMDEEVQRREPQLHSRPGGEGE